VDRLDKLPEVQVLSPCEKENRRKAWLDLDMIWRMEEIKAIQKSREKEIKEGDRNTFYFFAKANQRKKKKTVTCLETNGVMLIESRDMLEHALEFYKALFGKEDRYNIRLQESFWEEDENVTHEENLELEVDLSEEEIFVAIKGS
jgi:hypothetical protein